MLVQEPFRKCVSFVFVDAYDDETKSYVRAPEATAFYVAIPTSNGAMEYYAVTARHVVDHAAAYGQMYLRANLHGGGFRDFGVSPEAWYRHPSTDVAVARVKLPASLVDLVFIPLDMLATAAYVTEMKVTEGDKVFFIGLFNSNPGLERSQPIVRFGNVSLMPREPLAIKMHPGSETETMADGYLVEARSWGGHSGSPAFLYFGDTDRQPVVIIGDTPKTVLLGLVHGHFEIKSDVKFLGDILGSGSIPLNAGMALVIPAQHIIDLLMSEALVKERQAIVEDQPKA
jgi:hypothetical protein